ncbi:hypothetical protein CR513_03183, partial [Mucuna pruriens]
MARVIPVLYTVVHANASYNIIIGRPALNRLGAVVSTYHLCMKFPVGRKVASIWADSKLARRCYEDSLKIGGVPPPPPTVHALDLDLDPRCIYESERPHPAEDVKNVQIGPSVSHVTKVGTTLTREEEEQMERTLNPWLRNEESKEKKGERRPETKPVDCWRPASSGRCSTPRGWLTW